MYYKAYLYHVLHTLCSLLLYWNRQTNKISVEWSSSGPYCKRGVLRWYIEARQCVSWLDILTSGLLVDAKGFWMHPAPAHQLWVGLLPGHQVGVGTVLQKQADEGWLAAVLQHRIQEAGGRAPGQSLAVHRPAVVVVGVGPGAEQQPKAGQVVVGSGDVERTQAQRAEGAGGRRRRVEAQLVVHIHISIEPVGNIHTETHGSGVRASTWLINYH